MELLESNLSIVAAVAANVLIAAMKLAAGKVSGSSSMISEGVHSLVDMGNGLILLHGVRSSRRPPDRIHPFGHGQEIYFWTLIVAVVIFGAGGGVSIWEGIQRLRPHPLERVGLSLAVLLGSLVFEASSFAVAYREFRRDHPPGRPLWAAIRASKDPSRFAILFEDSAAIAGVLAAAGALALARALDRPWLDGAGSILVGVILCGAAVGLIQQARRLLIGQGLGTESRDALVALLSADPEVGRVDGFSSMYLGPHSVLVVARLTTTRPEGASDAARVRRRLKAAIADAAPDVTHVFLELDPPAEAAA